MRAILIVCVAALGLAACRPGAVSRAASAADDPTPVPAGAVSAAVNAANRPGDGQGLPERTYACRIWQPTYSGPMLDTQEEDRPYGAMTITADRYRLVLESGAVTEGSYALAADRSLSWSGDLGLIDDAPRRVTGSRFTTFDDVLNLVFDFAPATDGPVPHTQVICRAKR